MKILQSRVFIAGVALFVLTNIVVIAGALGNRSGEPEAVLMLTERELPLRTWQRQENSGLSLQLSWAGIYSYENDWLDIAKLTELGFRAVDLQDREAVRLYVQKSLPKRVYIVLEYDGPAYREALKVAADLLAKETDLLAKDPDNTIQQARVNNADKGLEQMKYAATRLYPVDAGPDPGILRESYPDTTHYIITTGMIRLSYRGYRTGDEPYRGYITGIDVTKIHVPLEHRAVFDNLPERQYLEDTYPLPRYRVELAYGSRYEPWLRKAELIKE